MYLPLAASLFIVAGMWFLNRNVTNPKSVNTVEKMDAEITLAKLIAQENTEWRKDRDGTTVGQSFTKGSYKLLRGTAVLQNEAGTTITLKAPVEFELLNSERFFLHSGELGIKVNKGTFCVDTKEMLVVDLGTEFSLRTSPEKTSLYVFEGEVGVFSTSNPDESKMDSIRLKEGKGLLYDGQEFVLTDHNISQLGKASDIYIQLQSKEYFVIDLAGNHPQKLNKLTLYNYGQEEQGYNYYSKGFTVQVSKNSRKNFKTVFEGTLQAKTGPQNFDIPLTEARYVKLIINSGYEEGFLELCEFTVFNTDGINVAAAKEGGKMFDFHSDYPFEIEKGHWVAANIIDGKTSGHASDSWASNGKALFDEFLTVQLSENKSHIIDRLVIYNYGQEEGGYNYYSKDFTILTSNTTNDRKAFKTLFKGTLKPRTGPQKFQFDETEVKFLKLVINSGYRTGFVQVGELEVYSTEERNVAAAENGGYIIGFSSQDQRHIKKGFWTAGNLIDGLKSKPAGSWCSEKLLPSNKKR